MDVRWHQDAIDELDAIERFIGQHNPAAASATKLRISKAVGRLTTHPQLGRTGRIPGTRELVVTGTRYIVCYVVLGRRVTVLAVMHVSQKWPDAL